MGAGLKHFRQKCETVLRPEMRKTNKLSASVFLRKAEALQGGPQNSVS